MVSIGEIVINMSNNEYKNGQVFQNADAGDMLIYNDILVWNDNLFPVEMMLGDTLIWDEL